jgi:hypothetical protein
MFLIEGHTDDVPYKNPSGNIKDNWDLSVLRATAIIRIILENSKIDPKRLSASGRGEYFPIDPAKTKEARAKNRRTEIILTPKLDDLFKIIETNYKIIKQMSLKCGIVVCQMSANQLYLIVYKFNKSTNSQFPFLYYRTKRLYNKVPDNRIIELSKPRKSTKNNICYIEVVDIAGLVKRRFKR